MSVKTTPDSDSTDYEAEGRTTFDRDAEAALDALPQRFDKNSRKYHDGEQIIIVPEHPFINDTGEECRHLMMSHEEQRILRKGFSRGMVTHTNDGVGVSFWYDYEGPVGDE